MSIASRITKLEKAAPRKLARYVIYLQPGETMQDAAARYEAAGECVASAVMVIPGQEADMTTAEWLHRHARKSVTLQ